MTSGKILHKLPIGRLYELGRASAAFSPDGKRIVTVVNWSVQLWDAETGKRVGNEHACAPSDAEGGAQVTFSPDSTRYLISCSDSRDDKFVSAWDCETSKPFSFFSPTLVPPILQHPEEVYGCSVHGRWDAHRHDLPGSCRCGCGIRKAKRRLGGPCVMRIAPETKSKASH